MKREKLTGKILGTALVFLLIGGMVGTIPGIGNLALADEVRTFPDPNLEAAIREAIGEPTGDILQSDLDALTTLFPYSRGITNITGLEYCGSLGWLDLYGNQIDDLTPLSSLTNLYRLYLEDNQISDIVPLSGLTNLEDLDLGGNQISDLTPLAGLTNLQTLELWNNQISDISPLGGLVNVDFLTLGYNQISDISSLSSLSNLTNLSLDDNQISDLTPLSGLSNLQTLSLGSNQISDLSLLSGLTNLWFLGLDSNQISDLSPLSSLTSLQTLYLYSNQISDLSPLSGLTNLQTLCLESNQISELSPLSGLTNLDYLSLDSNQISDLSPLSGLTSLVGLYLGDNQIGDISPLAGLTSLFVLGLGSNQISDLSPLVANPGLADGDGIDLRQNPLSQLSYSTYIPQLEGRGVDVLYDLPSPPTISFTPPSLSFSATEGGANPGDQTLEVWNSGTGTLNWWAADAATWLVLNPPGGSSTGEHDDLTVSVNISQMSAGSYDATITISAPLAVNHPQTVPVNLTISPAGPGIAWDFPSTSAVFLGPTPANNRFYLDGPVALPTGTEPAELSGVYWLDEATGDWQYFIPGFTLSTLTSLEPGQNYLTAVSGPCGWNLPCGEGSPWPTGDTWDFPSTSAVFLGPTPENGRPYLEGTVPLPTGTEPAELSGVYWLDEATGGWQYFIPGFGFNTLTSLEPDEAYLLAVSGPCSWQLA